MSDERMSAQEIIFQELYNIKDLTVAEARLWAEEVVSSLVHAGYQILMPPIVQETREEGEKCRMEECDGEYGYNTVVSCSCYINPPCWKCVDNPLVCTKCGDDQITPITQPSAIDVLRDALESAKSGLETGYFTAELERKIDLALARYKEPQA